MRKNTSEQYTGAMVHRAHKGKKFSRKARGFSFGELAKSGIEILAARQMGLPIDRRRRTVYDFNVDMIKTHATPSRPVTSKRKLGRAGQGELPTQAEERVETVEAAE